VHASILPRYRGAAPVHRAVIAGESETGVTIMRVVKALDAGPTLAVARRPIGPDETSDQVERDLAAMGARLLVDTLEELANGRVREELQDDSAANYAHRLTKADGSVDWTQPAPRVHDLIRGLHPWPHAYTFLNGRRFILLRSSVVSGAAAEAGPGTIIEAHSDALTVATGAGQLGILTIQPEGKRPMPPREFLAGHPLRPGDRFASVPAPA
jgi:methionyl-tRNA formyltransferase